MAGYKRAERKTGQCQRAMGSGVRDHVQQIEQFAASFIVCALTLAHTPKIKAHGAPTTLNKCPRKRLHHLVVHRAAKHRVRMGNDGRSGQAMFTGPGRRINEQFQRSCRAIDGQTLGM